MVKSLQRQAKKPNPKRTAGVLGILAVSLFVVALVVFANLNHEFKFLEDFVSRLGAKGAPYALWWNISGFLSVGILLIGFGISYGQYLKDNLSGILLAVFGLGFAFTAIPFDLEHTESAVSKAHTAAITLGLASWLFGLARISFISLDKTVRTRANVSAVLLVISMVGGALALWSMPTTHRLVFGVVFAWTALTARPLLLKQ